MSKYELLKSVYDYKSSDVECLEFSAGDYFYLYQLNAQQLDWWQVISMQGQLGLIPASYVCTETVKQNFYLSFLELAIEHLRKKIGKTEDEQEALAKLASETQQMKQLYNCNAKPAEQRECKTPVSPPKMECSPKVKSILVAEMTGACGQMPREAGGKRFYEPPMPSCHLYNPQRSSRDYSDMPRETCGQRSYEPPIASCQLHGTRPPTRGYSDCNPFPERYDYECRPQAQEMRPVCNRPPVESAQGFKAKSRHMRRQDPRPFSWCEYGIVVFLAVILLVGVSAMTITWVMLYREGYSWTSWRKEPDRHFNLHPSLMIFGFITLSGIAILLFRIFRRGRHLCVKLLHAFFHIMAVPCIFFGFMATWDSHNLNEPPVPHFYSLHSWLGLATLGLFAFQYACSFFAFLFLLLCYDCTASFRATLVPVHVAFGVLTFVLAICCCLTGFTETAFFTLRAKYVVLPGEGLLMNGIGVTLFIILALVVCILMPKSYSHGNRERNSIES